MREAWKVLLESGVPLGAIRPKPTGFEPARLREAVREISEHPATLAPRERDALGAWLRAFRRHWPSAFQRLLGASGESLFLELGANPEDPSRSIKLARIASENLAEIV